MLHDVLEVPFDRIAAILGRSTPAAKMLACRARGRLAAQAASFAAPGARAHPALLDGVPGYLRSWRAITMRWIWLVPS